MAFSLLTPDSSINGFVPTERIAISVGYTVNRPRLANYR